MLPTITKHSLAHPERIIDEYLRLGQGEIALRPVNRIGYACGNWEDIGYTAEEFNVFYDQGDGVYYEIKHIRYIFKRADSQDHFDQGFA